MSAPLNDRPRPLQQVAKVWGSIVASVGGVASALVAGGLLSAGQAEAATAAFTAVDGLLAAAVGVVTAVSALLAAFGVVKRGEPEVTPTSDPATLMFNPDRGGFELVPLVPDPTHPVVVAQGS